jgi:hypothetical protein
VADLERYTLLATGSAEIDALLAETNYAGAAPSVNGNARGTKRRSSSASTPTSQVFDHANGATSPSPTKRARIDKGQDMDEERTAGGAEEVEKEVNDKEQNNEEQQAEEDQEKTSADATSTGNKGDNNMEEEKEESEEEPKGKRRTKQKSQEKQASATKKPKKKDAKETKSSPTSSATKFVLLGTGLDAQKTVLRPSCLQPCKLDCFLTLSGACVSGSCDDSPRSTGARWSVTSPAM